MSSKSLLINIIKNNIENDRVDIAIEKLKIDWLNKEPTGWSAYVLIVSINKLVFTALKNKNVCKSSVEDIYSLTELCCDIKSMWKQDRSACMQCLYHVIRYMLSQSEPILAKKLCKYFFDIKKNDDFIQWEEKEVLVLSNSVIYFIYYINDIGKDIKKVLCSNDSQVLTNFRFVLTLSKLNNFTSTSQMFKVVFSLLRRAQNLLNHNECIKFSINMLKYFLEHLEIIFVSQKSWKLNEENITSSLNILSDIIFVFKNNDFSDEIVKTLFAFMDCLKNLSSNDSHLSNRTNIVDFELLKNMLKMCLYSTETTFSSYFNDFIKFLSTKTSSECFPFVHACLTTFRGKIASLLIKDDEKMLQLLPGLSKIYSYSKSKNVEEHTTKKCELLSAFTNAIYFFNSSKLASSTLRKLYKYVVYFFKEFDSLVDIHISSFDYGVNYCINAIQAYKESELWKEAAALSKSLLKLILGLNPESLSLDSFSVKLSHLLNFFIHCFYKMGLVTECQIALIGFMGVHPKFINVVFKYWAELKVLCQASHLKDTTCYEVITSQKNVIEEKWPPCKVDSINIEQLLFEELKAYAKHRELQVGSVVEVYKVASKLVKDKLMLANIVTATVDAISSDEYIPTLKNLHTSLDNLLNSNLKLEDKYNSEETEERQLCCHRLAIANIVYQLIRCHIAEIRKKAEDEFNFMSSCKKVDVPIIEGGSTDVTAAYTYLKFDKQVQLIEKIDKVIHFWNLSETIVTVEDSGFVHFRYMKGLAYICRLYSYKMKEIEIWKIIYKFAKKISNHKYQLLAVSELFISTKNVDSTWMQEAENIIKTEKSINKKCYIYSLYFVNLGRNLLMNHKIEEASKAIENLDDSLMKQHFLVNAQHKLLLFHLKRDKLDLSPERSEFTLYILVKIFESILFLIKNSRWNNYIVLTAIPHKYGNIEKFLLEHCKNIIFEAKINKNSIDPLKKSETFSEKCVLQWLLLEYSYTISKMYYELRLVRHSRCYAKKQLIAAQQLALPVRICEFLALLGLIDLQTGNKVDANEKLTGLDSILELDPVKVADSNNTDVCNYFCETSVEKEINKPKFVDHSLDCCCLICDNAEFLLLTLEAFTLKGIFASLAGADNLASHVFSIGESIVEFTDKKVNKCYSEISHRYEETKLKFYLNLTVTHAKSGDIDKALVYKDNVIRFMANCNRTLQDEINYYLVTLDQLQFIKPPTVTYQAKLYKDANESSIQNNKTPEQTKSHRVLSRIKGITSSKKFKVPVSPMASSLIKKCIFEDPEDSFDNGKYLNKENNDSSTPEKILNKLKKDNHTLAIPFPLSPNNAIKNLIKIDKSENVSTPEASNWFAETPKNMKTYSIRTRKVQTEKKVPKNTPAVNLFSTPFASKKGVEIKVFCDDENDGDCVKTVKRRGRPPKSTTVKKTTKKKEKTEVKLLQRRKLFDSDTEEEAKPSRTRNRLFCDESNEPQETKDQRKDSFPSSDESMLGTTFCEKSKICLPLTPSSIGLEDCMKMLSIDGKKEKNSLSTRNMRKIKTSQETPQSSVSKVKLRK